MREERTPSRPLAPADSRRAGRRSISALVDAAASAYEISPVLARSRGRARHAIAGP